MARFTHFMLAISVTSLTACGALTVPGGSNCGDTADSGACDDSTGSGGGSDDGTDGSDGSGDGGSTGSGGGSGSSSTDLESRIFDCVDGGDIAIGLNTWMIADGRTIWLDLEIADEYEDLGSSWRENAADTTVSDGWALWCVPASHSMDAVRFDADLPDGTNPCEGYEDANPTVEAFVTRDRFDYWNVDMYPFEWEEDGTTVSGCSVAAWSGDDED